jgi:hypothetical protein
MHKFGNLVLDSNHSSEIDVTLYPSCTQLYMHITCIYIYIYMCIYEHTRTYINLYVYMNIHVHTYIQHTHKCIHKRTYIHMVAWSSTQAAAARST